MCLCYQTFNSFSALDCLKLYSHSEIEKKTEFHPVPNIPIIFLCMRFTFYTVQLFVISCLVIIFFVCRFLPRFSLRGFSLRGKPCNILKKKEKRCSLLIPTHPLTCPDTKGLRDLQKGGYSIVFLMTHWPITDKMERLSSRTSRVLFSQFLLNVNQLGFTTFQGSKVHDIEC